MAFNPFITFQKNKRFWMAAILMICMISFVFCTGMRGGMEERIPGWFGRSGPAAIEINGRSYSRRDLENLKTQRNLANTFMKNCADLALKNVSKRWFEERKQVDPQSADDREKRLKLLEGMRSTLSLRKTRPRYFDGGVNFDDLVEFKLWQAEADRLGIHIEDQDLDVLFKSEFFISRDFPLGPAELALAQREAQRDSRDANDTKVRRAVAEEFRVKIAQYALLGAQPYSFFVRRIRQGGDLPYKFADLEMVDQVRAPLTLAQLWDFYKVQRAEFDVSLIPVHVEDFAHNKYDFAKKIGEPNEIQKKDFFEAHKNEPYDPSSDKWSLEIPPKIKIEYVIFDPTTPAYFGPAKAKTLLDVTSPFSFNPMQSLPTVAATYLANAQANKIVLQRKLETLHSYLYRTTPYFAPGSTTSILAWMAKRHPQAAASVVAGSFLSPMDGFGSLASYQAWGMIKSPLEVVPADRAKAAQTKILDKLATNDDEWQAAAHAELKRRARIYRDFLSWSMTGFPLDLAGPFLAMDLPKTPQPFFPFASALPTLPVEAVQTELEDMYARRDLAEAWAQQNILTAKEALKLAGGDAYKFTRDLKKLVKEMKLTYGPPDADKEKYYDRFTISAAPEFEKLKESYLKYVDEINLFEGRDLTPKRMLKPTDFYKMFFDPTEAFSASAKYQAMPWPPEVKPNNSRDLNFVNPRLKNDIPSEDLTRFETHIKESDPNREAPPLQLYRTAELPILFWRTAEINATRPTDYNKIVNDLKTLEELRKTRARLADIEKALPKEKDKQTFDKLKFEEAELKEKERGLKRNAAELTRAEPDLKEILRRVTEGWKFERARNEALSAARNIAVHLINNGNNPAIVREKAANLNKEVIQLAKLTHMQRENRSFAIDYAPPSLPKDKIVYPRDDMIPLVLSLFDLKKPIETGNKDLDEINKELYDLGTKQNLRDKDKFVQIIPDKPRSIFYVAVITSPPRAEPFYFRDVMAGAPFAFLGLNPMRSPRDYFVDRAQEQEAKLYRADFIRGLRKTHEFKEIDPEVRKAFESE
jgi:hypothetical protein